MWKRLAPYAFLPPVGVRVSICAAVVVILPFAPPRTASQADPEFWVVREVARKRQWATIAGDFGDYARSHRLSLYVDGSCLLAGPLVEVPLILERLVMEEGSTLVVAPYLGELVLVAREAEIRRGATIDARVVTERDFRPPGEGILGQGRQSYWERQLRGEFGGVPLCRLENADGPVIDLLGNPAPQGGIGRPPSVAVLNRGAQVQILAMQLSLAGSPPPKPSSANPPAQAPKALDGEPGPRGRNGHRGKSAPDLYLGLGLVRFEGLRVVSTAGDGGPGGDGTRGGGGGNASCTGLWEDDGGDGGRGGSGGRGGDGGDVGSLSLHWWAAGKGGITDPSASVTVVAMPGRGGAGGRGGVGGTGGRGKKCLIGRKGSGSNAPHGEAGPSGASGAKGRTEVLRLQNDRVAFPRLPDGWGFASQVVHSTGPEVCADAVPEGWGVVAYRWDSRACGQPSERAPNVARIERLEGEGELWVCGEDGRPPPYWSPPEGSSRLFKWSPDCDFEAPLNAAWVLRPVAAPHHPTGSAPVTQQASKRVTHSWVCSAERNCLLREAKPTIRIDSPEIRVEHWGVGKHTNAGTQLIQNGKAVYSWGPGQTGVRTVKPGVYLHSVSGAVSNDPLGNNHGMIRSRLEFTGAIVKAGNR